jgi:hypothetical protein
MDGYARTENEKEENWGERLVREETEKLEG